MSHRLPIICSDLPIIKELFEKEKNHFTFPNEDIKELAKCMTKMAELTPDQWNEMGDISLKVAASMTVPAIIEQWNEFLETV